MRIYVTSVPVDNQNKALQFYTEVLGFVKKTDIDLGEAKWLTVVSPQEPNGTEFLLEPDWNPAIQINNKPATMEYKKILYNAGIPWTSFEVPDIEKEHERLKRLGVRFTQEPTKMGPVTIATLDDTCGNLIQIVQKIAIAI